MQAQCRMQTRSIRRRGVTKRQQRLPAGGIDGGHHQGLDPGCTRTRQHRRAIGVELGHIDMAMGVDQHRIGRR
jgi:hypothetical protein